MKDDVLLTFNAGSSTVKFGMFVVEPTVPRRIGNGIIDLRHRPLTLHVEQGASVSDIPLAAQPSDDMHDVVDEVLGWISRHFDLSEVKAVGHRVVHGGDLFVGPTLINDEEIDQIEKLVPLAPLHQPQSLRFIRAIKHLRPSVVQTASFDTVFLKHYRIKSAQ